MHSRTTQEDEQSHKPFFQKQVIYTYTSTAANRTCMAFSSPLQVAIMSVRSRFAGALLQHCLISRFAFRASLLVRASGGQEADEVPRLQPADANFGRGESGARSLTAAQNLSHTSRRRLPRDPGTFQLIFTPTHFLASSRVCSYMRQ